MKDFFKSRRFKVLLVIFVMLFSFLMRAVYLGEFMPIMSSVGSLIMMPLEKLGLVFGDFYDENISPYFKAKSLSRENEELKENIRELNAQLVDYENLKTENESFREFLEIKDEHTDFTVSVATVSGRAPNEEFGSFIIDAGSRDGITPNCPVISADGMVGLVTSVSYNYSKVSTILDTSTSIGVIDVRTLDTGVLKGTISLAQKGRCLMTFVSRDSGLSVGDTIVTSGISGFIPKGLVIGKVENIKDQSNGISLDAEIKPMVDVDNVKTVMVITDFDGKDEHMFITE